MALSVIDLTRLSPRKTDRAGSNNDVIDLTVSDSENDVTPITQPPQSVSRISISSSGDYDERGTRDGEYLQDVKLKGSLRNMRSARLKTTNGHGQTSSPKSNSREEYESITAMPAASTSASHHQEWPLETATAAGVPESRSKKRRSNREKRSREHDGAVVESHQLERERADSSMKKAAASPSRGDMPSVPSSDQDLFFFDGSVGAISEADAYAPPGQSAADLLVASRGILLPSHVYLAGDGIPLPGDETEDADAVDCEPPSDVEFDDDRNVSVRRYWNESEKKVTCNICGEEGHVQKDCAHFTCSLCGTMDDHKVGSCPQAITCFRCGQRGHMSASCENAPQRKGSCTLCGSTWHFSDGCPAIWRKYAYVTPEQREAILDDREKLKLNPFTQGGEGFVGFNTWCFNCAEDGHWGGDCPSLDGTTRRRGPSIFFAAVASKGPFYNAPRHIADVPRQLVPKLKQIQVTDGFGFAPPMNVGSRGKEKAKRAHETAQSIQHQDDGDDWFDKNKRGSSSKGKGRASHDMEAGSRNGNREPTIPNKPRAMEIKIKGFSSNKDGPNPNFVRGSGQNSDARDRNESQREYEARRGRGRDDDYDRRSRRPPSPLRDRERDRDRSSRQGYDHWRYDRYEDAPPPHRGPQYLPRRERDRPSDSGRRRSHSRSRSRSPPRRRRSGESSSDLRSRITSPPPPPHERSLASRMSDYPGYRR
ncbi:hypothetical protein FRB94_005626 [Tulasnella sp. JGI-2019a]|nr:hypothetical protein FRB94_005626 [Tulasnella sp. JGI-2019a]